MPLQVVTPEVRLLLGAEIIDIDTKYDSPQQQFPANREHKPNRRSWSDNKHFLKDHLNVLSKLAFAAQ